MERNDDDDDDDDSHTTCYLKYQLKAVAPRTTAWHRQMVRMYSLLLFVFFHHKYFDLNHQRATTQNFNQRHRLAQWPTDGMQQRDGIAHAPSNLNLPRHTRNCA
jgi:hypothetical protein